jgi:hypothetical protein
MDDVQVRLAIYRHFAEHAARPSADDIAAALSITPAEALSAFTRLRASRVLYLEEDGETIRMAPPFSGVPTQHVARVGEKDYFANCAWDALGIPAALKQPGVAFSRCEQTGEPLKIDVSREQPPDSDWVFHCVVPAAHWWKDLVFT